MRIPTIKAYRFLSKGMFQATKEMKASFVNKPRQAALSKRIKARGFKFKHRNTPKFTSIPGTEERMYNLRYIKQSNLRAKKRGIKGGSWVPEYKTILYK